MSVDRSKEIENILFKLISPVDDPESKKVFFIEGFFGVGKTWLVDRLEEEIASKQLADALLRCEDFSEIGFLPDYLLQLCNSFVDIFNGNGIDCSETAYYQSRFLELLIKIKESDKKLFDSLLRRFILKSHTDLLLTPKSDEKEDKEFSEGIAKILSKKSDQRLIHDIAKVCSESFIVDLMNHFFPLTEESASYDKMLEDGINPKKIVIILDDYAAVAGSVNKWMLNNFIPFCLSAKFGDFISYDINFVKEGTKISEFFDFRFIMTSRNTKLHKEDFGILKEKPQDIHNLIIEPFTNVEITDFLEIRRVRTTIPVKEILDFTYGLPLVLNLWAESNEFGKLENKNSLVYHMLSETFLKNRPDFEKDWLRCTSFLDEFDENGLKCFPQINKSHKKALYYFQNTAEIFDEKCNKNALCLHPVIKKILREALLVESPVTAKEYEKIVKIYNDYRSHFKELSGKESDAVRCLAYFRNFDLKFAVKEAFHEDYDIVRRLIEKHADWFVKNNHTMSLNPDISAVLQKYNKQIDLDTYEEKKKFIHGIWEKYSSEIESGNNELKEELNKKIDELQEIEKRLKENKDRYSILQEKFISIENEMVDMRVSLGDYTSNKNLYTAVSNISIAVMMAVLAYFIPDLLKDYSEDISIDAIQQASFAVAGLFGIIGIVFFFRMMFSNNKSQAHQLNESLAQKNEQKDIYQDEMNSNKSQKADDEKQLEKLNNEIEKLKEEIQDNDLKLSESFIEIG